MDYATNTKHGGAPTTRAASRIQSDIELIKNVTSQIEGTTSRIIEHARSLGYFEPPKDVVGGVPMPVITTLADALQALNHASDHCSVALNVFD